MNDIKHIHQKSLKYISIALSLTIVLMIIQAAAAYYANSLALFADSTHMLVHNSSLVVALTSSIISFNLAKKNLQKAAYVDVIGGFFNCLIFIGISAFILHEGMHRIHQHEHLEINSDIMTIVSVIGFFIHSLSAYILSKGRKYSFNVQALFLHTFMDCLSTIITFIASLLISYGGFNQADGVASILISFLVFSSGFKLLLKCKKKASSLKHEIKLAKKITKHLYTIIPEINDIHNIEINNENNEDVYCAHVIINKSENSDESIKLTSDKIKLELDKTFNIKDSIIHIHSL